MKQHMNRNVHASRNLFVCLVAYREVQTPTLGIFPYVSSIRLTMLTRRSFIAAVVRSMCCESSAHPKVVYSIESCEQSFAVLCHFAQCCIEVDRGCFRLQLLLLEFPFSFTWKLRISLFKKCSCALFKIFSSKAVPKCLNFCFVTIHTVCITCIYCLDGTANSY